MIRRILIGIAALVGAALVFAVGGLVWTHVGVRRERAPLPALDTIVAAIDGGASSDDAPVRLAIHNTASQPMPRSSVLDPGRDPHPDDPYVMSHSSFVLEWRDGRILLVDAGMTREGAADFGRPLEMLGGVQAMVPIASVAEALGDRAGRVQGVLFTHLHVDHVGGIVELCRRARRALPVSMTEAQAERTNFTTRPGLALLSDPTCVSLERLTGGPLLAVPGFPGVFVIRAGGHTPGSQIVLAAVRTPAGVRRYAFTGDIVNHIDGINADVPKPLLYRLLIVPEADARQAELRAFLRRLRDEGGFALLVSHDQRQLEASGVPMLMEQRS